MIWKSLVQLILACQIMESATEQKPYVGTICMFVFFNLQGDQEFLGDVTDECIEVTSKCAYVHFEYMLFKFVK